MKKQLIYLGATLIFGLTACNENSTNTANNNGDSTKTTTSTTVGRRIANFESRSFVNLKTGKPVKLRYDTVYHYYVDVETNKEPDYYYYDPAAHDTFDYLGRTLNNALIMDNGDYRIDETRIVHDTVMVTAPTTTDTTTISTTTNNANTKTKTKEKDDKTKTKTKTDK